MRKCQRDMPCVYWWLKFRCCVDKHPIKFGETCTIKDTNSKLLEIYPLPYIQQICENCETYEPYEDWIYEGTCPLSHGGFTRNMDNCENFFPRKDLLEEAEKRRFAPWDK